jgi:hypothetical protein
MQVTTAVLFQTHFFDRWCARAFRHLAAGCPPPLRPVVLIHLSPGAAVPPLLADVPHHVVRTPEMRTPDYPAKSSSESWNLWGGGHTDLLALHYHRAHPGHERVWVVEYDIRFSGDWSRFFAAYDDDPTDLLAPGVIPRAQDPQWYNWPSFVGPGDLEEGMQLRAFMPIYRASAALLREMDAAYRGGWGGHCEATWPSLARAAGLSVADLGGDGPFTPDRYRGRFYSNCPLDAHLAPGTLVFKPAMYRIGRRPDMLWHPVKPFFWRAEVKEGLRDMRRRAGIALRGLAAHAGIELPPALQPGAFEAASRRTVQPAGFRPASDGPVLPKAEAS